MRLIHYSPTKIEYVEQKDYDQSKTDFHCKPRGFWFSVEGSDDWKSWCKSEQFNLYCLRYSYEITLKDDANVLVLDSEEKIYQFTKEYPYSSRGDLRDGDTHELDWFRIKKDFQGLIITPYQWECRLGLESSWYYPWDCSSGCIWDVSCIKDFSFIEEDTTVPTEPPPQRKSMVNFYDEFAKNTFKDCAMFYIEEGHDKHEYEFCERNIMNTIQYLKSKRKEKEKECTSSD